MKGLIVSLYAMTASFRDPNTHLYQETIIAPPPTTIVGISGAALGKKFEDALEYFKRNTISVGCRGQSRGLGKDLWNYSKISGKTVKKDILMREFLYDINIDIFIGCKDSDIIKELYQAFINPFFALTLGNSDELVKISNIEICNDVSIIECKDIRNTWICGNYINDFELDWEKVKALPIKSTIRPPIIKNLPIDFKFNDNDEREATRFSKFTFLGDAHLLREPITAYLFKDKRIPLFVFSEE
ncbi:CRISPR-associated protein Cas5 [Tissierella sp.]|uniref:CRISPR-associated protein Cas5 n=1 Tax=Tissierella sp. TaxID=41274 RepID=UPI00303C3157